MDCLCTSERETAAVPVVAYLQNIEHSGRHSVGRQQAFHLKCITDFTWKQKMTTPSIRGNRQKKKPWPASMTRNTNVLRLFLIVRVHPENIPV